MNLKVQGERPQGQRPDPEQAKRLEVARKFEGVLMQQLLQVMRNTAKSGSMMGSSGASGQYMSMFDEVLAERMAEGGGIGLANTIADSLGGAPSTQSLAATTQLSMPSTAGGIAPPAQPQPLPNLQGATARLAKAAYAISAPEGGKQWAREGTLTERDLASRIETPTNDGVAHFSVRDAAGFRDAYKCNLFAFEAARRAGFDVPVVARQQGWGYPTSNTVTEDAQDGALRGDWAEVVPKERIAEVKDKLERGELAIMLTGSGRDGRHGHMAVVERIHRIDLDERGEVKHIEFDGYEARVDGAEHLTRRSWNRHGSGEDKRLSRNGFENIELLALKPSASPERPEVRISGTARSSRADAR